MSIKKCNNNHYFDDDESKECPYCKNSKQNKKEKANNKLNIFKRKKRASISSKVSHKAEETIIESTKKLYNAPITNQDNELTVAFGEDMHDINLQERTGMVSNYNTNNTPIAGWLVCKSGDCRGTAFNIYTGRNYIGRNPIMDICIHDDNSIAKENQAAIIFVPNENAFYFLTLGGVSVIINNVMHNAPVQIKTGDEIKTGNTIFDFVAYCEGNRTWEEN